MNSQQPTARDTATNLSSNIQEMVDKYTQIIQLCYEALAPGKTQQERNELREALGQYLNTKSAPKD